MSQPITRKSLSLRIGGDMTPDRLRKNESRWGLKECRAITGTRSVLYQAEKALAQLRRRRLA